ncbi:hypothetical protein HPY26_02335 [Methylorubrum rhodesianum]|nr:hypothetical protein [Methylorubrum rhodesianum]
MPYDVDDVGHEVLAAWRRTQSAAVRSAYANAHGRTEKQLRDLLKARFAAGPNQPCAVDAWILHCATREGIKLYNQRPHGKMVFGGRKNLERRRKGLISAGDWRALRQRPLLSLGDKSVSGNRHFRLSPDARACTVRIYGTVVTLHLPEMRGKRGFLLRAVAALAAAGEINVEFRLGDKTLSVVFDPADLRRLPAGISLQQDDDARLAAKGHKARGRPRGESYKLQPFRWADVRRPVHPEWGPAIAALPGRVLAFDLNPEWIGLAVVESCGDLRCLTATTVLDHRLVRLDLPHKAPREVVVETLAKVAGLAVRLCEAHGVGLVAMEEGLGKLRSSGKAKRLNHRLNAWDRTTLKAMLERRLALREATLVTVWAAYSTMIGNVAFALPDACAAAAEIGRRGLAEMDWRARTCVARRDGSLPKGGVDKDLLPFLTPEAWPSLWKDSAVPKADVLARLRQAGKWAQLHREIKTAKLGVRRPHPDVPSGAEGPASVPGLAVSRLGHRRRPGLVLRVGPRVPDQPGRAIATGSRATGLTPRSS